MSIASSGIPPTSRLSQSSYTPYCTTDEHRSSSPTTGESSNDEYISGQSDPVTPPSSGTAGTDLHSTPYCRSEPELSQVSKDALVLLYSQLYGGSRCRLTLRSEIVEIAHVLKRRREHVSIPSNICITYSDLI